MNDDLIIPLGTTHPDHCPECGGLLRLTDGQWGVFYKCTTYHCEGAASAHEDGRPMGKAADKNLKFQRVIAHKLCYQVKEKKHWDDDRLYDWLTDVFQGQRTVHISDLVEKDLRILFRETQKIIKYG